MSDLIDRQELLRQIDIDADGEPGYYGDTWKFIDTIKSMPSAELGTNLAEVGTDCISRQAAIDAIMGEYPEVHYPDWYASIIKQLPSAQPTFDARDTQYNLPIGTDLISRAAATDVLRKMQTYKLFSGDDMLLIDQAGAQTELMLLPSAEPEQKRGKWILDRSGAYCCSKCMEPCAGYVMMRPRDKFCKMCGSRNEVTE